MSAPASSSSDPAAADPSGLRRRHAAWRWPWPLKGAPRFRNWSPETFPHEPVKTVVVLGCPRGGTSVTAGTLHLIGVDMGEDQSDKHEDPVFRQMLWTAGRWRDPLRPLRLLRTMRATIRDRAAENRLWGWKSPQVFSYIYAVADLLQNPVYVLVRRPMAEVYGSARRRTNRSRLNLLAGTVLIRLILEAWAAVTRRPVVVVDYAWALQNPRSFIEVLSRFLDLDPEPWRVDLALAFINPQGGYRRTNPAGVKGRLRIKGHRLCGWITQEVDPAPLQVQLEIDGRPVAEDLARRNDPRTREKGLHPTGRCGFSFNMRTLSGIRPGARAQVRDVKSKAVLNTVRLPDSIP